MFKVNKIVEVVLVKRRQNHITEVVVVSLMLTWTDNSNFSGCPIVDFEQVIAELNSANHNIQTFWYFSQGFHVAWNNERFLICFEKKL